MNSIEVHILHAFADEDKGGNPAGVVLNADHLSEERKLAIARRVGLSETAFVSASTVADFRLDFFTPTKRIPHCGHATIATFSFLKRIGLIRGDASSKETVDGRREIRFEGETPFMEQQAPILSTMKNDVLKASGLSGADLLPDPEPEVVSTGNPFLILPIRDVRLLQRVRPDIESLKQISDEKGLAGFYLYVPVQNGAERATTRMFAPSYGISEEAATGMAAGALAGFLDKHRRLNSASVLFSQGKFMEPPSPSLIRVRLEKEGERVQRIYVGGNARKSDRLLIPADTL